MLDLTRLDLDEPYALGDLRHIESFKDTDPTFLMAKAEFCKRMLFDGDIKIHSCMYSPHLETEDSEYQGDLYFVGLSKPFFPTREMLARDIVSTWRYRGINRLGLYKYSYKDEVNALTQATIQRTHWLNFVVSHRKEHWDQAQPKAQGYYLGA